MGKKIPYKALFLCFILSALLCGCNANKKVEENPLDELEEETDTSVSEEEETKESSIAFQAVNEMKVGWNLGNALDSCDYKKTGIESTLIDNTPEEYYETLWNNPVTTKEVIATVAKAGFGAVRVPVSYYDHMDENYQIREEWLDRVEEVVNYVLDNDMYCIINLHHEDAWLSADLEYVEENKEQLKTVWEQIAERFKTYDNHLLFEGFNEIKNKQKQWSNADPNSYKAVNQLNQVFVDTIRASTGYNRERCLIVNTYAAAVDQDTLDQFELPKDTIKDHLIVQIHTYAPLVFAWTEEQVTWTSVRDEWKKEKDESEIDKIISRLNERFVSQGIPVIIGEFAAWNKENTEDRIKYADYVVSTAKKYDIACFWWDDGGTYSSEEEISNAALLNRTDATWYYPELVDALVEAAE